MAVKFLLSDLLDERQWTPADLARATDIPSAIINEMYNGTITDVYFAHIDLICEALECDVADLLVRVPDAASKVKSHEGK